MADTKHSPAREAIVLTAERHFAAYGLHGASLRKISEDAKQKNASAIQYHFGSRDRLVEAVFEHRMKEINPVRLQMLEEIGKGNRAAIVRKLVSVWVWPLAEQLRPRAEGNYYLQFLSRAAKERELAIQLAPRELMSGWFEVSYRIEKLASFLPEELIEARLLTAGAQCLDSLAHLELADAGSHSGFEMQVENLIDMITAGMLAPMSRATKNVLPMQS